MTGGRPEPYTVHITPWVYERLRELGAMTRARGDGDEYITAVREFYHRLVVYPQFGDPLMDLQGGEGQLLIGIVPPLAMRYGLLESSRQVFVGSRPVLLSRPTRAG